MSTLGLILYTVIALLFSWFLITIGRRLFAIKSYGKHIQEYRKNPKKFDWFDYYFLGFKLWNAKLMEWTVKTFGDKLISGWYRTSGVLFIVFAVFFLVGTVSMWVFHFLNM